MGRYSNSISASSRCETKIKPNKAVQPTAGAAEFFMFLNFNPPFTIHVRPRACGRLTLDVECRETRPAILRS